MRRLSSLHAFSTMFKFKSGEDAGHSRTLLGSTFPQKARGLQLVWAGALLCWKTRFGW